VELVNRLRHLVSLDEQKNGGPYRGYAATEFVKAAVEAAARIEAAEASLALTEGDLVISRGETAHAQGYAKQLESALATASRRLDAAVKVIEAARVAIEGAPLESPTEGYLLSKRLWIDAADAFLSPKETNDGKTD